MTDNDFALRRASLRYLRDTDFVTADIAKRLLDYGKQHQEQLRAQAVDERDYSAAYLAAIAVRDVYYNLGVKLIGQYEFERKLVAPLDSLDPLITEALDAFDTGYSARELIPEGEGIPVLFEKLTYGKALANYTAAVSHGAMPLIKDPSELPDMLESLAAGDQVVDGGIYTEQALNLFGEFAANVAGDPGNYAWPHHIVQAERCTDNAAGLPYDCLVVADDGS